MPSIDYTCYGANNQQTHPVGLMRRPLCLITDNPMEAAVLQQLIHLTRTRETRWVQASARYLGYPFDLHKRTISNYLSNLEEAGFIESQQLEPGEPKAYCVQTDAVLESIRAEGIEMTRQALMGLERDHDIGGSNHVEVGVEDDQGEGSKDVRPQNDTQRKTSKNATLCTDDETNGHTKNAREDSLVDFIIKTLSTWSVSKKQVSTLIEALRKYGLSDRSIRRYVSNRARDFRERDDHVTRKNALRFIRSRQDLKMRGYIDTDEPTNRTTHTQETHRESYQYEGQSSQITRRSKETSDLLVQCREYMHNGHLKANLYDTFEVEGIDETTLYLAPNDKDSMQAVQHHLDALEKAGRDQWGIEEVEVCEVR
ncbi:MAG: hypothetical protein ABEN55_11280 [Bradymonadaceae bacterium]